MTRLAAAPEGTRMTVADLARDSNASVAFIRRQRGSSGLSPGWSEDTMDIAAVLFLGSLFAPPAVVAAGAIVLWPTGRRARRLVHIEHAVVQH